jgi:hypothetical protein
MKIIITESQYNSLQETFGRDRYDSEYSDEYPKYKYMLINLIKTEISASGVTEDRIVLGDSEGNILIDYRKGSRSLYYDYNWAEDIEKFIPWGVYIRHFKYALFDFFKSIFPDAEIKEVRGAHVA